MSAVLQDASCRQQCLVEKAFDIIAKEGFEGLRTRSVAQAAGISVATLHYYFPVKDHLIVAVAGYLSEQFRLQQAPAVVSVGNAAYDALRQMLANHLYHRRQCPHLMVVMQEFLLRARRDQALDQVLVALQARWHAEIKAWLQQGQQDGVFVRSVCADTLAYQIQAQLVGMSSLSLNDDMAETLLVELEHRILCQQICLHEGDDPDED